MLVAAVLIVRAAETIREHLLDMLRNLEKG